MAGTRALGTKFKIGNEAIAGLTSIGGLNLSAETIDATTLDSDGGYREFIAGFKDAGEVPISGYFEPSDSQGQGALYDKFESGDIESYSIIFPPTMGADWNFNGVVTGFSTKVELEDLVGFEATIKVSGKPNLGRTASADLTGLVLTTATFAPTFSGSKYQYTATTSGSTIKVKATLAGANIKLFIDGAFSQDLVSGTDSADIPVTNTAATKLNILVREEGKSQKIYEIMIVRS